MAPTLKPGVARRRLAVGLTALLLFSVAGCALAAQELRSALRDGPGAQPPRPVNLPDTLSVAAPGSDITATYRLEADLGPAPARIAIYLPGVLAATRIAVNGQVMFDNIEQPAAAKPRGLDRLRLVDVPPALVRPGSNRVEVRLAAQDTAILPPVWIGPADELRAMRDRRALLVVILPAAVAVVIGLLGGVVLLLYLRRREPLYGYFGIGALAWAVHTGWTVMWRTTLDGVHFVVWWTGLYTFFVAMLVIFCLRLSQASRPRVDRALWLIAVAAPAVLYGAAALGQLALASACWRLMLVAIVMAAVVAVARHAWRQRDMAAALLVATGCTGASFGLHDWWILHHAHDSLPVVLTPYSGLLFAGLVTWILIDRFVSAADALESMNRELELRVARKSEQLVAALDAMRSAKEAAEVANRAKSSFLAAASHDLRQPIHALGLSMAALLAEGLSHAQRELVQRMSGSLSALDSMFDALLDISRMDAGALVPRPRPFALAPMLVRLADEFAPLAARKGLRLAVRVTPRVRALNALSDPLLLERIVRNLLANAVKYTHVGGVLLSCRHRSGGRWRIELWDTGVGIAQAELDKVFDEFYQVGNPERDRAEGLGLGLSIVRRLTKLLTHRLELHSRPGRGTRFVLEVPMTDLAPEPEPLRARVGSLQGLAVAVIDDDPDVRDGMRALLERWGCSVTIGGDAHEVLQEAGDPPRLDAIVADLRLGQGRSGIDAVNAVRRACKAELAALVITGDSAPDSVARLEASGLPWLPKPAAAARLRSWLTEAARQRRLARGQAQAAESCSQ
jgi:signal transduction histidine kinase/ActR/RegA family two-component response regulator